MPAPTALAGTTDPATLQLVALLNATLEELRQAKCWAQQKRVHTFATVAGQASYQLPEDFYSVIPFTETDRANSMSIPAMLDESAAYNLYQILLASGNYAYRMFGFDENEASATGQFNLIPTPGSVGNITFEYLSRNLYLPKKWAISTLWGAGAYCNASGNIYKTPAGGTTGPAGTVPSHTTGTVSDGVVSWTYVSAPYERLIADTDVAIFDYDLVGLGVRAKFFENNGGAFEAPKNEFNGKIDRAQGRTSGDRVGSFSRHSIKNRYHTPYGGWTI